MYCIYSIFIHMPDKIYALTYWWFNPVSFIWFILANICNWAYKTLNLFITAQFLWGSCEGHMKLYKNTYTKWLVTAVFWLMFLTSPLTGVRNFNFLACPIIVIIYLFLVIIPNKDLLTNHPTLCGTGKLHLIDAWSRYKSWLWSGGGRRVWRGREVRERHGRRGRDAVCPGRGKHKSLDAELVFNWQLPVTLSVMQLVSLCPSVL